MARIKSAYEIAMERVEDMDDGQLNLDDEQIQKQEKLKPLMAKFYKNKIGSEGLWQELREEDEELLTEAQIMLSESFGLRTTEEQFKRRKEGLLAIETLKEKQNSSVIEQILNQMKSVQQKHSRERERIENQFEKEMENSQPQMKPVQTEDGRTVMKLEQSVDQNTKKRYNKTLSQLEQRSSAMYNDLVDELRDNLK